MGNRFMVKVRDKVSSSNGTQLLNHRSDYNETKIFWYLYVAL